VIATSRFPKDAAERFAAQPDVSSWSYRLHVFGLDLRDLASVEAFCAMIQRDYDRLDIIINNACQTVRRPPAYYSPLIENERVDPVEGSLPRLFLEKNVTHHVEKKKWITNGGYNGSSEGSSEQTSEKTRSDFVVSASETIIPSLTFTDTFQTKEKEKEKHFSTASGSMSSISTFSSSELSQLAMIPGDSIIDPLAFPDGLRDVNKQQVDLRTFNSWLLRAHEVSTPELVEVMAINAISPFILNARLKSLMEKSSPIISVTIPRSSSSTTTSSSNTDEKGTVQTTDLSSSSSTLSHHIIGHASLSSMSLAESILSSFSPENVEAAGRAFTKMSGGGSAKTGSRGHPVGGANKRPRKETGGGAGLEGEKAEHGVPASLCKFIVNVSSMEGKFYRAKTPSHPHTNMAKSSLNQLTRTSAGDYAESHIYMNAVDTGWINDENPLVIAARTADRHGFATPLDEVDAAARILDPVIAPLLQAYETGSGICAPVYGAFLKDFAETEW
jgi:NAD(P)-dependent dehydrogenase (short-subunit alcohol dehydrogenase family)